MCSSDLVLAEVRFEDRFDDEFHRHLRYPVAYRGYAQRPLLTIGLGDQHAPHRWGPVGFVFQVLGQFPQKRVYPFAVLYCLEGDPINAGASLVGLDQPPGVTEDVRPIQFVVERVKAVGRFLLGLGV